MELIQLPLHSKIVKLIFKSKFKEPTIKLYSQFNCCNCKFCERFKVGKILSEQSRFFKSVKPSIPVKSSIPAELTSKFVTTAILAVKTM